jgi:hypothetical protein
MFVNTAPAPAGDPLAVCNDGTPGAFYFAPATDAGKSQLFLVYLQGGMWCYDEPSCKLRAQQTPFLTSSDGLSKSANFGGIFDADPKRNPFAGANLVYLNYCSSDAWAGDSGPESNSFSFSFRGQRIITATLQQLSLQHGLGAPGSRLLFSGCSAGSRGAMFNLDSIPAIVGSTVAVAGFFDSPLWVDVQPLIPSVVPLENETQAIYGLINATARLGEECSAAYPGDEGWKCLYGAQKRKRCKSDATRSTNGAVACDLERMNTPHFRKLRKPSAAR